MPGMWFQMSVKWFSNIRLVVQSCLAGCSAFSGLWFWHVLPVVLACHSGGSSLSGRGFLLSGMSFQYVQKVVPTCPVDASGVSRSWFPHVWQVIPVCPAAGYDVSRT